MIPATQPAAVGDTILVEEHRLGSGRRLGEILEVLSPGVHEHYRVRWDDGRESIFYPSSNVIIRHHTPNEEPVLIHEP
jgi:hypothetical protein